MAAWDSGAAAVEGETWGARAASPSSVSVSSSEQAARRTLEWDSAADVGYSLLDQRHSVVGDAAMAATRRRRRPPPSSACDRPPSCLAPPHCSSNLARSLTSVSDRRSGCHAGPHLARRSAGLHGQTQVAAGLQRLSSRSESAENERSTSSVGPCQRSFSMLEIPTSYSHSCGLVPHSSVARSGPHHSSSCHETHDVHSDVNNTLIFASRDTLLAVAGGVCVSADCDLSTSRPLSCHSYALSDHSVEWSSSHSSPMLTSQRSIQTVVSGRPAQLDHNNSDDDDEGHNSDGGPPVAERRAASSISGGRDSPSAGGSARTAPHCDGAGWTHVRRWSQRQPDGGRLVELTETWRRISPSQFSAASLPTDADTAQSHQRQLSPGSVSCERASVAGRATSSAEVLTEPRASEVVATSGGASCNDLIISDYQQGVNQGDYSLEPASCSSHHMQHNSTKRAVLTSSAPPPPHQVSPHQDSPDNSERSGRSSQLFGWQRDLTRSELQFLGDPRLSVSPGRSASSVSSHWRREHNQPATQDVPQRGVPSPNIDRFASKSTSRTTIRSATTSRLAPAQLERPCHSVKSRRDGRVSSRAASSSGRASSTLTDTHTQTERGWRPTYRDGLDSGSFLSSLSVDDRRTLAAIIDRHRDKHRERCARELRRLDEWRRLLCDVECQRDMCSSVSAAHTRPARHKRLDIRRRPCTSSRAEMRAAHTATCAEHEPHSRTQYRVCTSQPHRRARKHSVDADVERLAALMHQHVRVDETRRARDRRDHDSGGGQVRHAIAYFLRVDGACSFPQAPAKHSDEDKRKRGLPEVVLDEIVSCVASASSSSVCKSSRRRSADDESASSRDTRLRRPHARQSRAASHAESASPALSLQASLALRRPDYIHNAAERQHYLHELAALRRTRQALHQQTASQLPACASAAQFQQCWRQLHRCQQQPPTSTTPRFNYRDMREHSARLCRRLSERRAAVARQRRDQQRRSNAVMWRVYKQRLQQLCLRGTVNMQHNDHLLSAV